MSLRGGCSFRRSNLLTARGCFARNVCSDNLIGDYMTQEEFRIEKDSLGEMKVPVTALYGAQTQRAVENFPITGLKPWRAFIWSIAAVKRAAAIVNYELGLFNDREVDGKHFTA